MTTLRMILMAAALLSTAACGWKSDGLERLEELYPTPVVQPDAGPPPDPCPMPDDSAATPANVSGTCGDGLGSGRWAVRMVQFGSMSPAGSPWRITLTDHFLAKASADGKALELTFCTQTSSLTKSDGSPVALGITSMPDKTRKAIGSHTLTLPLADGSLASGDVAWLWGVKDLANPLTDPLPTDKADAKVWDEDEDGNPGVTVDVVNPTGQRFMARRSKWAFGQTAVTEQWATGTLTFAVTENALDATNSLLKTVAPISVRSECTSRYQMRCVDAAYTCEQLVANAKALWRDAPAP
ncbi:MAG: hypothetical protein QM765_22610 [Myxococcales bacterium]